MASVSGILAKVGLGGNGMVSGKGLATGVLNSVDKDFPLDLREGIRCECMSDWRRVSSSWRMYASRSFNSSSRSSTTFTKCQQT